MLRLRCVAEARCWMVQGAEWCKRCWMVQGAEWCKVLNGARCWMVQGAEWCKHRSDHLNDQQCIVSLNWGTSTPVMQSAARLGVLPSRHPYSAWIHGIPVPNQKTWRETNQKTSCVPHRACTTTSYLSTGLVRPLRMLPRWGRRPGCVLCLSWQLPCISASPSGVERHEHRCPRCVAQTRSRKAAGVV